MFQFPAYASPLGDAGHNRPAGCPIRTSRDQRPLAPTPGVSPLVASFFAPGSLGIHRAPFLGPARRTPIRLCGGRLLRRGGPPLGRPPTPKYHMLIFLFLVSSSRPSMSKNFDPASAFPDGGGENISWRDGERDTARENPKKAGGAARLQKGGVPAAPSGTATLLRLSPSHRCRPSPLLPVTVFRRPRLPWLDGRCVQGPGTYSPRHG